MVMINPTNFDNAKLILYQLGRERDNVSRRQRTLVNAQSLCARHGSPPLRISWQRSRHREAVRLAAALSSRQLLRGTHWQQLRRSDAPPAQKGPTTGLLCEKSMLCQGASERVQPRRRRDNAPA